MGLFTVPVLAIYLGIVLCISRYAFWFVKTKYLRISASTLLGVVILFAPFSGIVVSNVLLEELCQRYGGIRYYNQPDLNLGVNYSSYLGDRTYPDVGCGWNCIQFLLDKEYPFIEMKINGQPDYVNSMEEGLYKFSLASENSNSCFDYYKRDHVSTEKISRKLDEVGMCLSVEKQAFPSNALRFERSEEKIQHFNFKFVVQAISLLEPENKKILEYKNFRNSYQSIWGLFDYFTLRSCGVGGYFSEFRPRSFLNNLNLIGVSG